LQEHLGDFLAEKNTVAFWALPRNHAPEELQPEKYILIRAASM
jgi:hypothetical protein